MANDENTEPVKKGFLASIGEGIKNVGFGLAALPAHIVTNPLDVIGKALVVGISATPGLGGLVTGAYVFKQSYRETGKIAASVGKAFVTGLIAAALPGSGAAITGAYATKNIGEQIQRQAEAGGGSATSIIKGKYREAGKKIKEFVRNPVIIKKKLNLSSFIEAIKDIIGPIRPSDVEKDIKKRRDALNTPVKESQGGPVMEERTSASVSDRLFEQGQRGRASLSEQGQSQQGQSQQEQSPRGSLSEQGPSPRASLSQGSPSR